MEEYEENRVFVDGLSWEMDDRGLESYYRRFGKVMEAKMQCKSRQEGSPFAKCFPQEVGDELQGISSKDDSILECNTMCSSSKEDSILECYNMCSIPEHLQDLRRSALFQLLSPKFTDLAFNLSTSSSGSIWNILKEEICAHTSSPAYDCDVDIDLLMFLEEFFSAAVVNSVKDNLRLLSESFLGPKYSMRAGKISIARQIVDDIFWQYVGGHNKHGPLAGFHGEASDADDSTPSHESRGGEWQEVRSRKGKQKCDRNGDFSQQPGMRQGDRDGRGGGRRGGRSQLPSDAGRQLHFLHCVMVEVLLSAFKTPPKPPRWRQDAAVQEQRQLRKLSISERSLEFSKHPNVVEGFPYDPAKHVDGRVNLYHGTRVSSLSSFQAQGIKPGDAMNEFHAAKAFYVSNSIRDALEHPLHYHPAGSLDNPIAVMVFDVDIKVLHGEAPAPGEVTSFSVLWFDEPTDEWAKFCEGNMNRTRSKHEYDVVIGHVCIPIPFAYRPLRVDLEGDVALTQVALCTKRARVWMESCSKRIYCEKRVPSSS